MSERQKQTRLAKERNHYWWRLIIDGRHRLPQSAEYMVEGPLPPECREELWEMVRRWAAEGKI